MQLHYIEFERFQKLHAQHTDRRSLPRPKTGHFDIVNGFKFVEEQEVTIQEILGTTNNKDGEELRPADIANEHRASYIEYKERNQEIFNMTVDKMCLKFDERLLKTRLQCMEEIVNIKKEIKDEEKSLQSKATDILLLHFQHFSLQHQVSARTLGILVCDDNHPMSPAHRSRDRRSKSHRFCKRKNMSFLWMDKEKVEKTMPLSDSQLHQTNLCDQQAFHCLETCP